MHSLEAHAALRKFWQRSGSGVYRRLSPFLQQHARRVVGKCARRHCEHCDDGKAHPYFADHTRLLSRTNSLAKAGSSFREPAPAGERPRVFRPSDIIPAAVFLSPAAYSEPILLGRARCGRCRLRGLLRRLLVRGICLILTGEHRRCSRGNKSAAQQKSE